MREILQPMQEWFDDGKAVALATVVEIYGSAPRGLGAKMAVNQDSLMTGSVSGGCVEGAVVAEALKVLKNGMPKLLHYGVTQDQAISVGLACGGTIEVWVEKLSKENFERMRKDLVEERLAVVVTVLSGSHVGEQVYAYPDDSMLGEFSDPDLTALVKANVVEVFSQQQCMRKTLQVKDQLVDVFFDVLSPSPKLVVVGAVHIAIPLVQYARILGFHTTVIDPRKAFGNIERFPHVDRLVREWPEEFLQRFPWDQGTYLVVVSHDDKLDVPALAIGCQHEARYIGALGSKKTFAKHVRELKEAGITDEQITRIHSPIGVDIAARGPEEIALAIITEMVAVRNGKHLK
ncbi:MAG: XdhC/CoxI family protein [Chloroflexi bacterium HGW-Chloroflexi-2]|jgi:xanthine dehydrogenase accessory factor|nr:MAG: XdhC/CoxI family protein [Chloroflexi bacterium HGW-Chloroflexi-2]